MVQYQHSRLDAMFGALADPTRRAVLAHLCRGSRSVGELARPFAMSLTGFMKHLAMLEDAGLIERRKAGRTVHVALHAGALRAAHDWLARHEIFWNAALDRLGAYVEGKEAREWTPPSAKTRSSSSAAATRRRSPGSGTRGRSRGR
jgi:DNA-binding transcriptional ArsR family regulator